MRISDWSSDVCSSDLRAAGWPKSGSTYMPRTESCWTLWTFKGHRISKVWFKCHLARVARKQGQRMKRLIDIAGSLFGLLLLSPVMLVAAIAIHRHMGEPVLFVQERPGLTIGRAHV